MSAMLKNKKWPYLCNGWTDWHEIWHPDTYWPYELFQKLKFYVLKFQDDIPLTAAILKNGHILAMVLPVGMKFGKWCTPVMQPFVKILWPLVIRLHCVQWLRPKEPSIRWGPRSPKEKGHFLGGVAVHCKVYGHSLVSCAKTAEQIEKSENMHFIGNLHGLGYIIFYEDYFISVLSFRTQSASAAFCSPVFFYN